MIKVRNRKSTGHICFAGDFEFFQVELKPDSQIFRAKRSNPGFTLSGYRANARWECTAQHLKNHGFETVTGLQPEAT